MKTTRCLLIALLLSAGLGAAHAQKAAQTPLPLPAYRQLVQDYAHVIAGKGRVAPQTAQALLAQFGGADHVDLGDQQTIAVDNSAEISALQRIANTPHGSEPDEDTKNRAPVLQQLVSPTGGAAFSPTTNPGAALRGVLTRREFQYHDAQPVDTHWFDRLMEGVGRAFERFFKWLFGGLNPKSPDFSSLSGLAKFFRWLLIGVLIVAVFAAAGYFGLRAYQDRGRFPRRKADTGLDLAADETPDPLAAAHRLAQRGDYRGAVRLCYIASLRRLSAAGLLVLEPNRTNWEYQSDLRARSQSAYALLLPATGLFDRIWYGRRAATPDEFARIVAVHDALPDSPGGAASRADVMTASATEAAR